MIMEIETAMTPAVKRLLIATETRATLIEQSCPRIRNSEERKKMLPLVTEIQATIDIIIAEIRMQTGNRFDAYSDVEIACLCHVWAAIWTDEHELMVDSQSFANIVGKNQPEQLGCFIAHLLDGTSPLAEHVALKWHPLEGGLGLYRIKILDPAKLTTLILEKRSESKES